MKRWLIIRVFFIFVLLSLVSCTGVKLAPVTGGQEGCGSRGLFQGADDFVVFGLEKKCLEGRWEVAGLEQMIAESYARNQSGLRLESVRGRAVYEFDGQRQLTISYEGLVAAFSGVVDGQEMSVHQLFEGSATAQYMVGPDSELVLSGFGDGGIYTSLEINGQRLAEGSLPLWRTFTSSLTGEDYQVNNPMVYSIASAVCQRDELSIQAQEPFMGPVIALKRLP